MMSPQGVVTSRLWLSRDAVSTGCSFMGCGFPKRVWLPSLLSQSPTTNSIVQQQAGRLGLLPTARVYLSNRTSFL